MGLRRSKTVTDQVRRQALRLVVPIVAVALTTILVVLRWSADRQAHTAYLPLHVGPSPSLTPAVCTEVSDGDSIWVDLDGDGESDERVRYLLIDAPERGECYSDQARDRNIELVYGKKIGLEMDIEDRDSYDRLLRYVWVDGQDVGGVLLREGYGRVEWIWHGNARHLPGYLDFQDQAIAEGIGMWGVCDYPTPTQIPMATGTPVAAAAPAVVLALAAKVR